MTAPNIETIAASLRSCSLGGSGGGAQSPPHLSEASDESTGGITVDLNSEPVLPYQWEQCLDMRTGEIYYINWETGVRTTEDPRATASSYSYGYYYSDEDGTSDEYSCSNVGSGDDYEVEDEDEDEIDTADSSTLSSASPPQASSLPVEESSRGGGHILVAAGCKCCFMYFMVPKRTDACPKCGGGLLHLGRNGCV